jgi:hypothetical protein
MKLSIILLTIFSGLDITAQDINQIHVKIVNAADHYKPILNDNINLFILTDNFGNGSRKAFRQGELYLNKVPSNTSLKYMIEADSFYSQEPVMNFNVLKNAKDANFILIPLLKVQSRELILRGKVAEQGNEARGISGCQIEINMDLAQQAATLVTDDLGYFRLFIPNGQDWAGSHYTITLRKSGYVDTIYSFSVDKGAIISLKNLLIRKKPSAVTQIQIQAPPVMLKTGCADQARYNRGSGTGAYASRTPQGWLYGVRISAGNSKLPSTQDKFSLRLVTFHSPECFSSSAS